MRREIHRKDSLKKFKYQGKIILIVLFVIIILFLLYSLISNSSGIFTSKGKGKVPLSFTADVYLPAFELKVDQVALEMVFEDSEGDFFLSDLGFENLENAETRLENYKGKIIVDEAGTINLEGYTEKVFINNLDVNKGGDKLGISVKNLEFSSLKIFDLSLKSFSFVSSGNINVGDGGSLAFGDGKAEFEISPFTGSIEIEGSNLKLTGESNNLMIKGITQSVE